LDAIRSENKYLRSEIHKIREQCIQQHMEAEQEEEMITNKLLGQLSRNSAVDYGNDINSLEEGRHGGLAYRRGSVDSRVQFENIYSEEQEYRINKLQNRLEKTSVSMHSKRSNSPGIASHRRDHSTPTLLPILDEYCPALLPHQSTPTLQRSASTVTGLTLSTDSLRLLIKSLQYRLALSERTHEKKIQRNEGKNRRTAR